MAKAQPGAAWYERQLERARAKRRTGDFKCPRCGVPFRSEVSVDNHRIHTDACRVTPDEARAHALARKARYYRRHNPPKPPPPAKPKPSSLGRHRRVYFKTDAPIPVLDRHPLLDEAVARLKPVEVSDLFGVFDNCINDRVMEYVLAVLEGRDPMAALEAERKRLARDRRAILSLDDLRTELV